MADAPALELAFPAGAGDACLPDRLYATLDDFSPLAIEERDAGRLWRVFFATSRDRDGAAAALAGSYRGALASVAAVEISDEDWARRSQAGLGAVHVGRVTVSPPWDPAVTRGDTSKGSILIVIEPSMGFGTGHHATTRLCLELLQEVPVRGRRVADLGTGSGVLAIAAARLGASAVLALDRDPDALDNARANVAANGVAAAVDFACQDLAAPLQWTADIAVANLTAAALQQYAHVLTAMTGDAGTLIVSGFAPNELGDVERAFGVRATAARAAEGWAAASFTPRPRET